MQMEPVPQHEGAFKWETPGAGQACETWYKLLGDIKNSKTPPLILLHGGPGGAHEYLLNFRALAERGIPLVFYDQLGCGRSTHLKHKNSDESFWTIELFVKELGLLIDHLGIRAAGYDVLGQSWGSILGAAFAIEKPVGLRRLVLSSGLADSKDFYVAAHELRSRLPQEHQDILNKGEAEDKTETKEYQDVLNQFYLKHVCKNEPFPDPALAIAFEHMYNDANVYETMWGRSEVALTGSLRDFSLKDRLHRIQVPVLLLSGEDDECGPSIQMSFFETIHKVRWFEFAGASHAIHLEQPDKYFKVIADFLTYDATS